MIDPGECQRTVVVRSKVVRLNLVHERGSYRELGAADCAQCAASGHKQAPNEKNDNAYRWEKGGMSSAKSGESCMKTSLFQYHLKG